MKPNQNLDELSLTIQEELREKLKAHPGSPLTPETLSTIRIRMDEILSSVSFGESVPTVRAVSGYPLNHISTTFVYVPYVPLQTISFSLDLYRPFDASTRGSVRGGSWSLSDRGFRSTGSPMGQPESKGFRGFLLSRAPRKTAPGE